MCLFLCMFMPPLERLQEMRREKERWGKTYSKLMMLWFMVRALNLWATKASPSCETQGTFKRHEKTNFSLMRMSHAEVKKQLFSICSPFMNASVFQVPYELRLYLNPTSLSVVSI